VRVLVRTADRSVIRYVCGAHVPWAQSQPADGHLFCIPVGRTEIGSGCEGPPLGTRRTTYGLTVTTPEAAEPSCRSTTAGIACWPDRHPRIW
jgi:hypothetical protein